MSDAGRTIVGGLAQRLAAVVDDTSLARALSTLAGEIDGEPPDTDQRISRLVGAFGLSPFERDLLVLIGLPEEHEAITAALRRLHPLGEPSFALGVLAEVIGLDHQGRHHLRRAIEAGPLRQRGLVAVDPARPLPEAGLRLAEALWSAVRGVTRWPSGLQPLPVTPTAASPATVLRLATATEPSRGNGRDGVVPGADDARVVLVTGADGRPVEDLAATVAAALTPACRPLVFLDAAGLDHGQGQLASIHAVVRGAVPVVVGRPGPNPLPDHPGPVVVCLPDVAGLDLDGRPVIPVDLGPRTLADDVDLWRRLLGDLVPPGDPAERDRVATELAGLLRVDAVRAARAVGDARATAAIDTGQVNAQSVVEQVRRRSTTTLPASVRLVRPTARWDALITTPRNHDLLLSIVDRIQHQARVLSDWRFGERHGRNGSRGARALFTGPPGTGKTLSAEVVAGVLGLDLLVVDLSALVSKWLGETEKNISEVFDAAARCQSVLFFDEADAVFGRRTDGSDAQGRWANLETAHLLTRMENFGGLVVLASNLRSNIDDAFVRRLDVIVEFDEPSLDERRRLWCHHLPPGAPRAADVDVDQLAELYPIAGGLIRNATLDAAFRAAAAGNPIDQLGLVSAVEREFTKAGRTFPGIPRNLRHSHSHSHSYPQRGT